MIPTKSLLTLGLLLSFSFFGVTAGISFSSRYSSINLQSGSQFTIGSELANYRGILVKDETATISGENILFNRGTFEDSENSLVITGTFQVYNNKFVLFDDQMINAEPGKVLQSVFIAGDGVVIKGQPTFDSSIGFDTNATLSLGIQSKLNKNLEFDSGGTNTLYLIDDLHMADHVNFIKDCTIDINGKSLWMGAEGTKFSYMIDWYNAGDINLTGYTRFSGHWNIWGEQVLNGHGNILDVSGGGVFDLRVATTFHLTDVVLLGVGSSTFNFRNVGSTVRFSNVSIQLNEDVSHSQGMIFVDGPSTAILHDHNWAFNSSSHLTVSTVTLWKDDAGASSLGDITGNLDMVDSGTIRAYRPYWLVATSNAMAYYGPLVLNNSEAIVIHETEITNNSESIAVLDSRVDTAEINITNNSEAIVAIESGVTNNAVAIANNSEAIVVHESEIDTNASNIAINVTNISNNSEAIVAIESDIGNVQTQITNNSNAIVEHESEIDTNISNIATNVTGISNNSEAIINTHDLAVDNSEWIVNDGAVANALVFQNSEAIVVHETEIDTNASNIAINVTTISNNSEAIVAIEGDVSSNAVAIANNSEAIVVHETEIDTNTSNIATNVTNIANNSNAIVEHESEIDTNISNIVTSVTNISNNSEAIVAIESDIGNFQTQITNNSNAIVVHESEIDTNVSNIATNVTNISNNSEAIVVHESEIDTNASGIATNVTNISNNSEAIVAIESDVSNNATAIANNSEAIVVHETEIDTNVSNIATNVTNISNNSEAIVEHESEIDTNISNIATNVTGISNNSEAIINTHDLAVDNSEWIVNDGAVANALVFQNSEAIVEHETEIDANASNIAINVTNISNNSEAIVAIEVDVSNNAVAIANNSEAIVVHEAEIDTNASNIATNVTNISNNSEAIVSTHDLAVDNSEWIVNDGAVANALVFQNSEAIVVHETEIDTNASNIATNVTNISNNSEAIINTWDLAVDNSEWIVNDGAIANALVFQNSNAIVVHESEIDINTTGIANNSEAIVVHETEIDTNASNIATNVTNISNNSEAIVCTHDLAVDNSEWIVNDGAVANALVFQNSEAIVVHESEIDANASNIATNVTNISNNSEAIVSIESDVSNNATAIANNSEAIVVHEAEIDTNINNIATNVTNISSNSEAIVSTHDLAVDNSEWIVNDGSVANALVFQNSEAIVVHESEIDTNTSNIATNVTNISNNSEAIVNTWDLAVGNSNAIISGGASSTLSIANSEAVISVNNKFDFVYGDGDIIIDDQTGPMNYDIYISPHHQMSFTTDVVLNGSTHFIHFSDSSDSILSLDAGISVTLQDVVLRSFSDSRIKLGAGASLIFGDNTTIELSTDDSLARKWLFHGNTNINSYGSQITFGEQGGLYMYSGCHLTVQHARLIDVKSDNICCQDGSGNLTLRDCELVLTDTFNFNSGSIIFDQDVHITGTQSFVYSSSQTSTIASYATLFLEQGCTFNYDPLITSSQLLEFQDNTSRLVLNDATLHTTGTALSLKKGTLEIIGTDFISTESCVVFGDDNEMSDINCIIHQGSKLNVSNGEFHYRNVGEQGFNTLSNNAYLSVQNGAKLRLYQILNVGSGVVQLQDGSTLIRKENVSLQGSIAVLGNVTFEVIAEPGES